MSPAPWGRVWPGWAVAHDYASQQPGDGPPPRLYSAVRGRCGQSWGILSHESILGEMFGGSRVHHAGRPSAAGVRTSCRGDGTSDSKTLPETVRNDTRGGGGASDSKAFPTTVRNGTRLRRFPLDKVCRDNPPPLECYV
jgi:hypothetical protein